MPDFMRLHTQNGDSPSPFLPIWQINDTLEEEDCYRFLAQRWCTSSFWSKSIWQIFNGVVLTPDGIDDLFLLRETGVLLLCLLFAGISELKVDEALSFQSHMVILSNAHLSSTLPCLEKNPEKCRIKIFKSSSYVHPLREILTNENSGSFWKGVEWAAIRSK